MAFAANNSSIFGPKLNTTPVPATTGLFGQQQPSTTGSNMFGQANPQQQGSGGNIFGTQQSAPGGSNIFGQSTQQPAQQATGSSLFGQASNQQPPAAGTGSNLFGQQTQQQPAASGGSIFGSQQPATGLFGQPAQNNQSATGSSLFGQSTQGSNTGPNLFGQPAQQQQQQGNNIFGSGAGNPMFGNNNLASSNTGFGTSTFGGFGQKPAQPTPFGAPPVQQQQQPAGPPAFSKTTKFNDLPDDLKRGFEQFDSHVQGQIQICKDLQQRKLGEEATKGHELIRVVQKDLFQTGSTIRNDLQFTRDLKAKVDQAVHDTIIATRIIDGSKNQQSNFYLKDHASFPLEFFTRVTTQIRERLVWYRATIEQIERKLSSMANQTHITPQGNIFCARITTTLQAQNTTFLALASRTAALDAELQKIKTLYTQLWRARTGSVRDPFESVGISREEGKADFGLSGLSVR